MLEAVLFEFPAKTEISRSYLVDLNFSACCATRDCLDLGYCPVKDDMQKIYQEMLHAEIIIIATGSQGESSAALGRMALGQHRHIKIKRGDTVVLSSRIIPGNEIVVNRAVNRLFQRGARGEGGQSGSISAQ